jgi:uncharacterized protein YjiS (DUF1127 family)
MNGSYDTGFGGWFSTLAALAAPAHQTLTRRRLYEQVAPLGVRPGMGGWLRRVGATLALWRRRTAERQALLSLDDHILRDIGLSRREVELEGRKPFWRD